MIASPEIEKTVLGACLIEDAIALDAITSAIGPEHFSLDDNRTIFRAVAKLADAQKPVNPVTVFHDLAGAVRAEYVASLTDGLPRRVGANAGEYSSRLVEAYRKRQLVALSAQIGAMAEDAAESASGVAEFAQTRLGELVAEDKSQPSLVRDLTVAVVGRLEEERKQETSHGLSFGVDPLDELTGGILAGQQIVVGARSGVGKTTLMAQAIHANCKAGIPVDAFLLEPTRDDLLRRLYALEAGLPYDSVLKPWAAPSSDWSKIRWAYGEVAEWPLRIHDKSNMALEEIIGLARLSMHRFGTRLVCVDYLQRIRIKQVDKGEDLRLRIGRASLALANLVKGTQCATMLLSQLSRRSGVDAIPTMQDLRESGQIENDAHTIVLLHLNYDADNGHYLRDGAILVPKRRHGLPGNIRASVNSRTALWESPQATAQQSHWTEN